MDFAGEAAKMVVALAAVIGMLIGGLFILRRMMGEGNPVNENAPLRVLGGLRLGAGKSIMVIDVAGKVLVVGATAKDLMLLSHIEDDAKIERLRGMKGPWGAWGGWPSLRTRRGRLEVPAGSSPQASASE